MHHKLKIKLVAMLATMTGSALGTCHAMQTNAGTTMPVDQGVVQQAEPAYQGAFGAVKMAKPMDVPPTGRQLPPIVSANEFAENSTDQPMVLPPIVKPFVASSQPEETARVTVQPAQPMPAVAQGTPATPEPKVTYNGLMPMTPLPTPPAAETAEPTQSDDAEAMMAFAPAPVISADATPVVPADEDHADQAFQWDPQVAQGNGVSAAGIPLYPQASPTSFTAAQDQLPPIVQSSDKTTSVFVPTQAAGSDIKSQFEQSFSTPTGQTPPMIAPTSKMVSPGTSFQATAPIQTDQTPIVMPNSPMRQTSAPMPANFNRTSIPANSAPIPGSNMRSSQDPGYFAASPGEAPVIVSGSTVCDGCGGRGCPECGVTGAIPGDVAGCSSCGPGGCFNGNDVNNRFNTSGSFANARRYLIMDALYLDRYDGTVAISNFGGLNNFEDDLVGARVTFGRREDCANGDEFSYFGSGKLSQSAFHTDAAGRISIGFPNTGTFATETTAFRNAVEQTQFKQTTFQSIEYNRNDWGWDVIRTFWGIRYIYVQDEYSIASRNLDGENGLFEMMTFNNLLGPQFGYELFWDVGYRLSFSTVSKFGLYANPNQVNTQLFNAGAQFLDLKDNNTSFAGTIELGVQAHYKLTEHTRFRFGYNGLYMGNVAGVSDNIPTTITPTTGSDTSDSGEMFFQGIGFGFEIYH